MSAIQWDPLFECGDQAIDEQHRSLVDTINRLEAALSQGRGREVMGSVLDELENYVREHFGTEEDFFAEVGYPGAAEHIAKHRAFSSTIAELRRGFEGGDEASVVDLLAVLGDWFVRHVSDEDIKYRPYLSKRG
ncbi:MAG TPA: bacteriohemerythrin [Rectinemataceae bacterium]|nr:bacteriohemerythrin [Rectinemataceae bacterium]